jgi:hypothetical protein
MRAFARFLNHAPPGLYRLATRGDRERIGRLCRLRGIELLRVDGHHVRTKGRLLAITARALHLPAWFGMNWDALADCLTDFAWERESQHLLWLANLEEFATRAPADFAAFAAVLEEVSAFWAQRDVRLLVVVEAGSQRRSVPLPEVEAP